MPKIDAERATDYKVWSTIDHEANKDALIHALGLHKDRLRGRTHIVVRGVEWVPSAKNARNKFRVASCGVFKISDILTTVEKLSGITPGTLQKQVDAIIESTDGLPGQQIPIIFMTLGLGGDVYMNSSKSCRSTAMGRPRSLVLQGGRMSGVFALGSIIRTGGR